MRAWLALLILSCILQDQDRAGHESKKGNYKVVLPAKWRKMRPPNELIDLAVTNMGQTILVFSLESKTTAEGLISSWVEEQSMVADAFEEVSRRQSQVAGERAVEVRIRVKHRGIQMTMLMTAFTHQGIAYQVVGNLVLGELPAFEKIYKEFMDSFAFLEERKEWIEKYAGKPARTALLGGLVSFELNRPRWTESTFDSNTNQEYGALEQANFKFMGEGGWVTVRVQRSTRGEAEELNALESHLASFFKNAKTERVTMKTAAGAAVPYVHVQGEQNEHAYVERGAAFVKDGIACWIRMEALEWQRNEVKNDWQQLVSSLELSAASELKVPAAYPVPPSYREHDPDPGLAAFLAKATRLLDKDLGEVVGFDSAARRVLVNSREALTIVHLETGRHEPVSLAVPINHHGPIAWSADGSRLAFVSDTQTFVATLGSPDPKEFDLVAAAMTFGPGPEELTVCAAVSRSPTPEGGLSPTRLVIVNLQDGSRREAVKFALSRMKAPRYSPDGKRLAVISNREYPRTAAGGGNVEVYSTEDWTGRVLTRGAEDYETLSWSPDGRFLYGTRRLSEGEDGAVGEGGPVDLVRISVESGEVRNLTRSGRLGRGWRSGEELWIQLDQWNLDDSQRGVFRISEKDLEAAVSGRPEPKPASPKRTAKAVAAKVSEALEGGSFKAFVPTPEKLARVADRFAQGVESATGHRLDFSAESLDRLSDVMQQLELRRGREPLLVLGLGAYYGETLRRIAGAEWKLQGIPFGDWFPGQAESTNAMVNVVLPFSSVLRSAISYEDYDLFGRAGLLQREPGPKFLLVYPPARSEEVLKESTPAAYLRAKELLKKGETEPALEALVELMKGHPKNSPLAREVIAICEAAGLQDRANGLAREAVQAGNEVPEILLMYVQAFHKGDSERAIPFLRKGVQGTWPNSKVLIELGRAYRATGREPIAQSCWRRAHRSAGDEDKALIRELMGLEAETEPDE